MGASIESWPKAIASVIRSGAKLGYSAKKHNSMSRHRVWIFLLHNGAPPELALQWLHESKRVDADALHELVGTLRVLRDGNYRNSTTCMRQGSFKEQNASLPEGSRHGVDAAHAYASKHGTRGGEGNGIEDQPFAAERSTYFETHFPIEEVVRLVHRRGSPFQLREITTGRSVPIGRDRPVLSLQWLRWAAHKRATSLHAGSAYDAATQAPILGESRPISTELCLEVDDLPEELEQLLKSAPEVERDALRWIWLKHSLQLLVGVLRDTFGVKHVLSFVSGNRSPHCWLLDEHVLQQTATERKAFFTQLQNPTAQHWWKDGGHLDRCMRMYNDVLLTPCSDGGFGLTPSRAHTANEIAALTWPTFDEGVALGSKHTHRMPFSIHDQSMRVAVPFALDRMPERQQDAPHVADPALAEKLKAPLAILRTVLHQLQADNLLSHEPLAKELMPIETAAWAQQAVDRKRKRGSSPPDCVSVDLTLSPLRIELGAARAWRKSLATSAASPATTLESLDTDVRAVAKNAKDGDWRARLQHEVQRLDVLLGKNVHTLDNVVRDDGAGGRVSVFHRAIGQFDFLKGIASITRHKISGNLLLELDISAAHPSAAWGALVAKHGAAGAEDLCPCLALLVKDRETAINRLASEYARGITPEDAKTKLLRSLNQTADDETHAHRKPFLRKLVEERPAMEAALLEFAPIAGVIDAIRAKAEKSGKASTLLALLMQACENAVIVASIPRLAELGWAAVGVISDALLLEAHRTGLDESAAEAARREMQDVGRGLGILIQVKIDHAPSSLR